MPIVAMITRIAIKRRAPFAKGYEFPVTGAYEKLVGKIYGEVDPKNRLNKVIVNLDKAPRNRRGRVEYWSDFCILKPVDMARGNGKIFYDAPNRGSKRIVSFLNDAPASNDPSTLEDAGNGFLMRQGYTIVWCGWQGDLMPQRIGWSWVSRGDKQRKRDRRQVRTEIVVEKKGIKSQPLSGDERVKSYEAASRDKTQASLTVREKSYGQRITVPSFRMGIRFVRKGFANRQGNNQAERRRTLPSSASNQAISTSSSIRQRIRLVLGLGFAVVRDLVSFLRYEMKREPNPPAKAESRLDSSGKRRQPASRYAYGWGRSQSGRFLRDFVYHGFNEDESHRKVFDAIAPHVAGGGRLFLNYEFARPVTSSQQHTNQLEPELFPHAYNVLKDAQTGRRDGILKRPKTDPYVFHTQTSTEYWQKRGCLAHTDGKGRDVTPPDKVRIYVIASAQHNSPFGSEPVKDDTQQLVNPLPAGDVLRALMVALDLWVTQGISPPPSQYPRVGDGTLVRPDRRSTSFPKIPAVRYQGLHNRQLFLDYGRTLLAGGWTFIPRDRSAMARTPFSCPKLIATATMSLGFVCPSSKFPSAPIPVGTCNRDGWRKTN